MSTPPDRRIRKMSAEGSRDFVRWGLGLASTLLVAMFGPVPESRADLMKYAYSGVVTSDDPRSGIAVGTTFSGTFAYNPTEQPPPPGALTSTMNYSYGQVPGIVGGTPDQSSFMLQVGGQTLLNYQGGIQVGITDYNSKNQYGAANPGPSTSLGIAEVMGTNSSPSVVSLSLVNPTTSLYGSLASPSLINLANFPQANLYVYGLVNTGSFNNLVELQGTITSLEPIPAPEPATWILIAAGAASRFWWTRRRRVNSER